jgi:hypothetical protein
VGTSDLDAVPLARNEGEDALDEGQNLIIPGGSGWPG